MQLIVTQAHLEVNSLPESTTSLDVSFDGRRIFSVDVEDLHTSESPVQLDWPAALAPHLTGRTRISISDSESGTQLSEVDVAFDDSAERTTVQDPAGVPLVVNKWGRLGASLEGLGPEVRRLIVERSLALVDELKGFGLRPFVVGGTLLGGVRDGALLPHDDDADIAYLSEHTQPADVAVEAFAVGHRLAELGYEIQRHSATHMQLLFRDADESVIHYIDVFAAFFSDDGRINQPFHVRGEMRLDQMLPFGTVTIEGSEFPAPADTNHWLTLNYDERWREPIPGFVLETPAETRKLFDGWFGGFNFQREFWDERFIRQRASERDTTWELGASWIAAQNLRSATVLDLGSGSGALSSRLSSTGRRVIACDYSSEALRLARLSGLETSHVNLYRLNSLTAPRRLGIGAGFDVAANHLFEQVGHLGRANAFRLARMALRSGGSAVSTAYAEPAPDVNEFDPTTWHLDKSELRAHAREFGLVVEFTDLEAGPEEEGRSPYGAIFSLNTDPYKRKDLSVKHRLRQLFLRARSRGNGAELDTLRERVSELETELTDIRRDNLRVAELIDLAEQTLMPPERTTASERSRTERPSPEAE